MLALLPGDALPCSSSQAATLHLGPGLSSHTTAQSSISTLSVSASNKGKQRATEPTGSGSVAATRAGLLGEVHQPEKSRYWIEGTQKRVRFCPGFGHPPSRARRELTLEIPEIRCLSSAPRARTAQYVPQPPEPVLGIIIARHAEGYRVDIGSSQAAALDALAFEGATKRNKPNLKVRFGLRDLCSTQFSASHESLVCPAN